MGSAAAAYSCARCTLFYSEAHLHIRLEDDLRDQRAHNLGLSLRQHAILLDQADRDGGVIPLIGAVVVGGKSQGAVDLHQVRVVEPWEAAHK